MEQVQWGAWGRGAVAEVFELEPPTAVRGPLNYVMVNGRRDDGSMGPIGALWLTTDLEQGGFIASPLATWSGGEMASDHRGAQERGWDPERIHRYWLEFGAEHPELAFGVERPIKSLADLQFVVASA